jgi:hypothetical protein
MNEQYLQLGATFVVAMALIELIKYIIGRYTATKPNGSEDKKETEKAILEQVQLVNENHLDHIQAGIDKLNDITLCGFKELTTTSRDGDGKMIALLSEIKGQLSK